MSTDGNASIRRENIIDDAIGADEVETGTQTFAHLAAAALASQAQAEGGINEDTLLTPLRVKQAITALAPTYVNATELLAGRMQLATLAQMASHTDLGSTGATLAIQNKYTSKTPDRYTPAYMTGGASAEAVVAVWDSVSDGEFTITIDGTAYDITGLDFSAVTDMDDVAAVIQVGIRAATSSTETCVWSTDHFIITSVDSTSTSEVSVTSTVAAPAGTDISGAGAGTYMDSDSGQGTATAAALDITLDAGMVPLLLDTGLLHADRIPIVTDLTATAAELNKLASTSANVTATNLNTLTGAADADALHTHPTLALAVVTNGGNQSRSAATASGDQVIAHGLGRTPKQILFFAQSGDTAGIFSTGLIDDDMQSQCTSNVLSASGDIDAGKVISISDGTNSQIANVTAWDATNFTLTWTKGASGEEAVFTWIALA